MRDISSLIDLTLLNSLATANDIQQLSTKGTQHQVAALCVLPQHLNSICKKSTISRATVVNFPTGNESHSHVLNTINYVATHYCIHEIDYVFPYQAYLNGDAENALSCCAEAYQQCKQHGLAFKVILETGALLSPDIIYKLSLEVIKNGCDFLKTSTGKITTGATIPAATAMLSAIIDSKQNCGIKLSGGIKTIDQAITYIELAESMMRTPVDKHWFRFGASGLLDLLCQT